MENIMEKEGNLTEPENDVPYEVWAFIHQFLLGTSDTNLDLREAHMKPSFTRIYPFVIFMYALLVLVGLLSNFAVFVHIIYNKLYSDGTFSFILNNAVSDILKCIVIIPISLYVLLIQNWTLGELLCSFLPMMQDIPLHTSTLTFLLLAWDRFRFIRNPTKPRIPAFVCAIGTWLTSLCLVLPYPIYIIYIDLGKYSKQIEGVGLCTFNLVNDMREYMRGIFLVMYVAPLSTISYLFIQISRELSQQSPAAIVTFQARTKDRSRADSHSTEIRSHRLESDRGSSRGSYREFDSGRTHYEIHEPDINVTKEKRTQKFLVFMITAYGICLCPLMILRLARLTLVETYDNSGHFDITFAIFVWVAFVPTCSTPLTVAAWQMSRTSKERLRGYFRFSNRKLRQSCETVVTAAGTPAAHRAMRCHQNFIIQPLEEGFSETGSSQHDFSST